MVRYDPAIPTQRALAAQIQGLCGSRVQLEPAGSTSGSTHPQRLLDLRGREASSVQSARGSRLRLSLHQDPAESSVSVGVSTSALLKCVLLALPTTEQVAVIHIRGQRAQALPRKLPAALNKLRLQSFAIGRPEDLQKVLAAAAPFRPDLIVLQEGAGLDAMAPKLLAIAKTIELPVATNIPWLAKSGATVAVTPRLDTLATGLSHWLTAEVRKPFSWSGVQRRTLNLDRLSSLNSRKVKARVLAAFDVIIQPEEGGS